MLRCAFLLLLASLAAPATGQTFERFGVRDGLSSESITDISVDARGVIWVATEDGLNRYDGHNFRTFRHQPGVAGTLPSSGVATVLASRSGAVWVGTARGIARLDPRTGRFETFGGTIGRTEIASLGEDTRGELWIGTQRRGLWRYRPSTGAASRVKTLGGTSERIVSLVVNDQQVWFQNADQKAGGICQIAPGPMQCIGTRSGSLLDVGGEPLHIEMRKTVHWLGTDDKWQVARLTDVLLSGLRTKPGEAWVASQKGIQIVRKNGTTGRIVPDPTKIGGLGGYDIRSMVRDPQGNVWIGTESGLYVTRTPVGPFETFRYSSTNRETLSDNRVNGMAEHDGFLWVTTNDGLNRLDLSTGRVRRSDARVRPASFHSFGSAFWQVLATASGDLLVGAKRNGVMHLESDQLRSIDSDDTRLESSGIRGLLEDSQGRVWIASDHKVWRRERNGQVVQVPLQTLTSANTPYLSTDGTLWIASDGGLLRYVPQTDRLVLMRLRCPGSTSVINLWSITETALDPGALWLASMGNGLIRFAPASGEIECLGVDAGLPTASIASVVADARGALWAGTSAGLARLGPISREVATFTSADGLQGDAFNLMAALPLSDGRLAFGGPGGLTLVTPEAVQQPPAPTVVISGFERAGRLQRGTPASGDTIRLTHDESAFGIRFAAMDFRAPRQNRYQYRLIGLDGVWQRTDGSAPRAAFAGVAPGVYRFEVIGAAADTPFGEPTVLWLNVVPAVWQRLWFRLGLGLLALGAVLFAVYSVTRRRTAEAERLEAEAVEVRRRLSDARERERVRLARDLHDGPVQNLYRVGHDLDRLGEKMGPTNVSPVRERVGDVARSLRQMLVELRPTLAEHLGLGPAIRTIARHTEERYTGLTITVRDDASGAKTDTASRIALFRIAQEAIENVGRHAEASKVKVTLSTRENGVRLVVRDNGRGFAVPSRMVDLARQEHFGLVGARERAEAAGGTFQVQSVIGKGTTVDAWVPAETAPEAA